MTDSAENPAPTPDECTWTRLPDVTNPLETHRIRFKASCTAEIGGGVHPFYPDNCPVCGGKVKIVSEPTQPSSNQCSGTFICPVCGYDKPHHHPLDAIRWHEKHLPIFKELMENDWPFAEERNWYPAADSLLFYSPRINALWQLYQRIVLRGAHETGALQLTADPQELLVTTARDAGFSDAQWKAMFYESGPYDITFPCFTTKKFITLLLERLQPAQETPVPHHVRYDVVGWLCSVCGGWNDKGSPQCVYTHATYEVGAQKASAPLNPKFDRHPECVCENQWDLTVPGGHHSRRCPLRHRSAENGTTEHG